MPVTSAGTAYTVHGFTSSAGEQAWRAVADNRAGASRIPTVLFCHGNPGTVLTSADQQFTQGYTTLREWLIDNGWAYIEGHGAGAGWGNTASRLAYRAMLTDTQAVWSIGKLVVIGRSMGGLVGAWLASRDPVVSPLASGFVCLSGTQDLSNRYSTAAEPDRVNLRAAYGVTDEAGFRAAVTNHDPMLAPLSTWDGRNAIQQWATGDTTVPPVNNGQAWLSRYGTRLAISRQQVTSGGDHNSTPNDPAQAAATIQFLRDVPEADRGRVTAVYMNSPDGLIPVTFQ